MAFDILYSEDWSVKHLQLRERHRLLREAVREGPEEGVPLGPRGVVKGRIKLVLPEETPFSVYADSVQQVRSSRAGTALALASTLLPFGLGGIADKPALR